MSFLGKVLTLLNHFVFAKTDEIEADEETAWSWWGRGECFHWPPFRMVKGFWPQKCILRFHWHSFTIYIHSNCQRLQIYNTLLCELGEQVINFSNQSIQVRIMQLKQKITNFHVSFSNYTSGHLFEPSIFVGLSLGIQQCTRLVFVLFPLFEEPCFQMFASTNPQNNIVIAWRNLEVFQMGVDEHISKLTMRFCLESSFKRC